MFMNQYQMQTRNQVTEETRQKIRSGIIQEMEARQNIVIDQKINDKDLWSMYDNLDRKLKSGIFTNLAAQLNMKNERVCQIFRTMMNDVRYDFKVSRQDSINIQKHILAHSQQSMESILRWVHGEYYFGQNVCRESIYSLVYKSYQKSLSGQLTVDQTNYNRIQIRDTCISIGEQKQSLTCNIVQHTLSQMLRREAIEQQARQESQYDIKTCTASPSNEPLNVLVQMMLEVKM